MKYITKTKSNNATEMKRILPSDISPAFVCCVVGT